MGDANFLRKAMAKKKHFDQAQILGDDGEKALVALREAVDSAETLVAEEFWPMAKYQELLTSL